MRFVRVAGSLEVSLTGFAVAFAIIVLAVWFLTEQVQRYLYDDLVTGLWWRAVLGAVPLAALVSYAPLHLDAMFLELQQFCWVLVHAAAWALVLWWPIRFLPPHAAILGPLLAVLFVPLVCMAVESFLKRFGGH